MELKYAKAKQYGLHNFNKDSAPLDYVTMRNLQEYPAPPQGYKDKFNWFNNGKFKKEDLERIFLYGEYIKRKFFIDCLFTRVEQKNTFKYIKNTICDDNECMEYLANIFILKEDRLNFHTRCINSHREFINSFTKKEYNIYNIISDFFYSTLEKLRNIFSDPENFCEKYYITNEDIIFLKSLPIMSNYVYERILYNLPKKPTFKRYDITYKKNNFCNTLRILNNAYSFHFDNCFLMLYRYIIDKYSLYMSDLLMQIKMEDIIINYNKFTNNIPHFFFIPNETQEDEFIKECINIITDEENNNIKIDIKLVDNLDSLQVANYIRDTLMSAFYFYKENKGQTYSSNELSYFINKLDTYEKHNKISFYSRIYGLYIWDKIHIHNDKNSINSICMNFNKKFPNREGKKDDEKANIINLRRCYIGTLKSIEELSFKQLK